MPAAFHLHMTVAVGTQLGTGTGLAAGVGAGGALEARAGLGAELAAGTSSGAGATLAWSRTIATFEPADGAQSESAASMSNGVGRAWLKGDQQNQSASATAESFKANWQSMLRAGELAAHREGKASAGANRPADETDTAIESSGRESVDGLERMFARPGGRSPQPILAASASHGPMANPANDGSTSVNRPQPAINGSNQSTNTYPAAARSGAMTAGSGLGSSATSANANSLSGVPKAAATAPPAQESNVSASPFPDGFGASGFGLAAAAPLDLNIRSVDSASPSLMGRVYGADQTVDSPAPKVTVSLNGAEGEASTAPALAPTNSSAGARAFGQTSVHPMQSPANEQTTNAAASSAAGEADVDQNTIATPPQGLLNEGAIFRGSANPFDANRSATGSGVEQQMAPLAEVHTHRGLTSGTSASSTSSLAGTDKPGVETGNGSGQSTLPQMAHGAASLQGNAANLQQSGPHAAIQSSGTDASALMGESAGRDSAAGLGTSSTPATTNIGSAGAQAATAQDTFAALDAGTAVGAPNWVHAGGRQAEAGFEDPALGWVSVRADLSAGGVHAAVVPGSTEAAQALSGHLAGLSAYLSEEHTPVATLTMAAPQNGAAQSDLNQGMQHGSGQGADQNPGQAIDQGMQQSAGQGREQNPASGLETRPQSGADDGASVSTASAGTPATAFDTMTHPGSGRGMHISVMA